MVSAPLFKLVHAEVRVAHRFGLDPGFCDLLWSEGVKLRPIALNNHQLSIGINFSTGN